MARIISVPPLPERVERNSCATRRFSEVAGTGAGNRMRVSPENVIRLKVSRGLSDARASRIVAFAFSIGAPDIDPEVSSTKTNSLGATSGMEMWSGG